MRSTAGIALCFLTLSAALVGLALTYGAWFYLLFYPAVAFTIVAIGYLGAGQVVFGKRSDGRRHWLASLLVWPYLISSLALWHLVRLFSREAPVDEVLDELLLSRRLLNHELPEDVRSVVDLTCELTDPISIRQVERYLCFPMLDAVGGDAEQLVALAEEIMQMPKPVLIHCAQGHGRTGLVAAVVLLTSGIARSTQHALEIVSAVRPGIKLSRAQSAALQAVQTQCARLRVDGIYSAFDGAMYRHLRFFENGKVAFLLIALDAHEVADGLNEAFQAKCGGTFQLQAGQISFIIIDRGFGNREDVIVEYRGEVCINSLLLDIYSHTTQHRSCEQFTFIPVKL